MKQTSTNSGVAFKKYLVIILTILSFSFSQSVFAQRLEVYTVTGCSVNQNVTCDATVKNAASNTCYTWQYKDDSGNWQCFNNGSNNINGNSFTCSGARATNAGSNVPMLTISNSTTALDNVCVRVLMRNGGEPCGAPTGSTYGGDDLNKSECKVHRIRIYGSTTQCGATTPECVGNLLNNTSGYYGGCKNKFYNATTSSFSDENFLAGCGSTEYTVSQSSSATPGISGHGTCQVWNNPYTMNNSNTCFAPHTGNFQMLIHGSPNIQRKAWYKTITVTPGATYIFSFWVARTQGSNAFNVKLMANGTTLITGAVSTTIGQWNQISGTYTVPAGVTSIEISISDVVTATDRYFSIDDICFTQSNSGTGSIGDRVWLDANGNGLQDASETGGITGVTVQLRNSSNTVIATTLTNSTGNYIFTGLASGIYTVVFPLSVSGALLTTSNVGTNDNIDSDPSQATGITANVVLTSGQNITNVDAGYTPDCSCTNSANNLLVNGSFENGTTGWSWSGGTLTTGTGYIACGAANGFNNWSSGTAKVWQDVAMTVGSSVTFKAFAGTHTAGISCSPTLSLIFLNAANTILGQSNVTVTRDVDLNNNQLAQYSITAVAPAGTTKVRVQSSITCNTMKIDAFCLTATPGCNVTAGTDGSTTVCDNSTSAINLYNIITGEQTGGTWSRVTGTGGTFVAATGTFTPATGATTSTFRYVVTGTAPCTNDTSVATVIINPPANAGADGSTTVCDTLATAVNLYNVITGEQTGGTWSRVTGTGGTFNAAAGTFLPAAGTTNSTFRYVKVGTAPCPNDSSIATVNIQSCQLLTLGNRVWYDANNNGLNDATENGIRNVSVKLYADANNDNVADGASIASAITDVNGNYSFTNLSPGNYIVGVIIPNGYMSSNINGGDPDNNTDLDDNGQVLSGNEIRGLAVTLASGTEPTSGSTNNTYDFGLLPDCNCTTSASNLLVNGSFENGTTGWSWSAANGSLTTGTGYIACGAANGFNNQISGTSKVWQDVAVAAGSTVTFKAFAGTHTAGIACSPTLSLIFLNAANTVLGQSNVTVTRDVDINNNQLEQYSITAVAPAGTTKARVQSSITCNTMKMDAFCLNITAAPLGSIGDRVWEDTNRDGVQDAGELGLAGITVRLYDNTTNTVLATAITNATGNYLFSNLTTGAAGTNYQVGFTLPSAQFMFSPNNGAVTDPSNSDANTTTGRSGTITLTNATPNATYADAGIYRLINISGNVWNDANGLTDLQINKTGTQAIPNSLNIYLVDVATNQIVQSESINFDGTYNFFNVDINHSYKIVLSTIVAFPGENSPIPFLPSGWQRVGENLGAGPLSGSDGVPNGLLFLDTETSDVIDANFGIRVSSGEVIVG